MPQRLHTFHVRWRSRLAGALLLILAAVVLVVAVRSTDTVHSLPEDLEYMPYRFAHASPFDEARLQVRAADLDGDGIDEIVTLSRNRRHAERFMAAAFVEESQRYSITQMNMSSACELMGVMDLTGDGQHEIIWSEQRPESVVEFAVTEFDTITVDSGRRQIGSLLWDATGSTMDDGVWGGGAYLISAFDLDGNGTRETVLLGMNTGVRRTPRGLWLIDWETSRLVGKRETAATPRGGLIVDVDGDGTDEIVIALESPGNGAVSEPFDDGHSYIAVFEMDLSLTWWRELAGYTSLVSYAVSDLDGDGAMEVVTGVSGHHRDLEDDFAVGLWSGATGEPLTSLPCDRPVNDLTTFSSRDGERLYIGLADGRVFRFEYAGGTLVEDAAFRDTDGVRLVRAMDFGVQGAAQTLIVMTVNGTIVLVDDQLAPLAAWRTTEAIDLKSQVAPARFSVGGEVVPGMIFQTGKHLYYTYAERVPLPPWLRRAIDWLRSIASFLIVAVATLVVAGAVLPRYRRRAFGAVRRRLLPRRRREAELDEFLEQLKTGGHGMLSATKTLRRLAGQYTMLAQHEGTPPAAFTERYREAVANAQEVGLPMVREIVDAARRLGLAPLETPALSRALADMARAIDQTPAAPPGAEVASAMHSRLEEDLRLIERGIGAARREAQRERSTALSGELARVLSARAVELGHPGMTIDAAGLGPLENVRVVGTPAELTFVFDNLVENALRATRGVDGAEIRLTAEVDRDDVTVRVRDTGRGIDPAEHDRIFHRGVSERDGGGHGLPRSREILERRGGSIELVRSAPGEGAVFKVKMKAVSDDA